MNVALRSFAKRLSASRTCLATFFACLAALSHVQAEPVATVTGSAAVSSGALAGATGVISLNEAAGLANVQSNQAVIAGNAVGVGVGSIQAARATARVPSASAAIGANAFSNTTGAVAVNQAAGAANLQRNSVVLGAAATGVEALADSELSAAAPNYGRTGPSALARGVREVSIGNDAFKNASGIVQINQTAGAGNATANSFVLRPPAGTFF
jgi:hypothetical protein